MEQLHVDYRYEIVMSDTVSSIGIFIIIIIVIESIEVAAKWLVRRQIAL